MTAFNSRCAEFGVAFCDNAVRCGQMNASASCQAILAAFGFNFCDADLVSSIKDSRLEVDVGRADACFNALKLTSSCASQGEAPECEDLLRGRVVGGGQCFNADDCVPTHFCQFNNTCPGTCAVRKNIGDVAIDPKECPKKSYLYDGKCATSVAQGSSCAPVAPATTQRDCADGSFCNQANLCVAQGAATAACNANAECQRNHVCLGGTCQALGSPTAACDNAFENTAAPTVPDCKVDLYCDVSSTTAPTGVCKVLEASAGACFADFQCQTSLYCNGEDVFTDTKGTCATRLTSSTACTLGLGNQDPCARQLYCSTTCQAKKANGVACASNPECVSGNCNQGVCKPSDNCADPTP